MQVVVEFIEIIWPNAKLPHTAMQVYLFKLHLHMLHHGRIALQSKFANIRKYF